MEINHKFKNLVGIYSIFNVANGKKYIGSSKDIYNRWHEHLHLLRHNRSHNNHLQAAFNKYGEDNFVFNILEFCKEDERFDREQYYIDFMMPEYNFSLNVLANIDREISEKQRKQISETLKKKYASGKLTTYIRKDISVNNFVYNIETWKLAGYFETLRDTARALNIDKTTVSKSKIIGRIYLNKYIIVTSSFKTVTELKNFFYENYMKAKTTIDRINYIISIKNDGNLIYYRSYQKCAEAVNCSPETLRNHNNATIDNPYIIEKSGLKFCVSDKFIPLKEVAVPIEESLELLQTNIGEGCDANTEISTETNESVPVYSVETEPEKSE